MKLEISIVGLNMADTGKSCENHVDGCGWTCKQNDYVTFEEVIVTIDGMETNAVCVMNEELCTIAYVGKDYINKARGYWNLRGKVLQVNRRYKYGWARVELSDE